MLQSTCSWLQEVGEIGDSEGVEVGIIMIYDSFSGTRSIS